ncbi:type II toxin-antitoxin system CcdA family antitoxin [Pseudonocardia abyssalis]|jgi:post-segregation antitoxin (ccd killing protein)|uniref:Type II toxin-antitoxin system CcdA family antitoxin n=1 Tax=Pseudonocardia abyssalis TaxID=2792008 RepID=A0ABS6UPY3_9PSEU|nr:type II toxin-antitoxin system CcdA family antitoxin [Pseudonocardia abyssalis]MBW0115935.1 type II toxin-antitoxin system CcdA family antitoxin [Pseudonocardia abyssalis]MBW0134318.1 type II toxin-antitoxin system CcdA family antitoxin [Pseudonocardia abyssalis]
MARVNITIPDELLARARAAGLNVSAAAAAGLTDELVRMEKNAELDRWLAEMEAEQGPSTPEEIAEADARIDRAFVVGGTRAESA